MEDVIQAWLRLEKHWKIEPSGKKIGKYRSYGFLRYTVGSLLKIVTRIKTTGRQNIPKSSPFVIAGNHLSHVDPIVIIITSGKKIHYLAKDGHFQNFFLRHFMRLVGQIETNRDTGGKQALSMAADVIANNKILGIFPEGTRSKSQEPPYLSEGKTGVARLAASFPDMPILPVAHWGTREMMIPKKHKWPRFWRKAGIAYGKPTTWHQWLGEQPELQQVKSIEVSNEEEVNDLCSKLYRKFTDDLMQRLGLLGAP